MKLFWVTTEDHGKDWFVIANDFIEAEQFHEDSEGYETGEAAAEVVMDIPDSMSVTPGWPDHDVLKSLGAKFLRDDNGRVVIINGKKYSEGLLDADIAESLDNLFEEMGQGRLNKTEKTGS